MESKKLKKVIDLVARGELIEPLKIINIEHQDLMISRTIYSAIRNEINLCKDLCNYCNKDCKQGKLHDCDRFDADSEFVEIVANNIKNDPAVQAVIKNRKILI